MKEIILYMSTFGFFFILLVLCLTALVKKIYCIKCHENKTVRGSIIYRAREDSCLDEYICKDCNKQKGK